MHESDTPTQEPYKVIVFTSTYNRRDLVARPYQSLLKQTYRNFVWFLVDDGSTDDTASRVAEWQSEGHDWIHYVPKDHGGLHMAWNLMLEQAEGDFVIQLDSDDELTPDGIEKLVAAWESIPIEKRKGYIGVCANCVHQDGELDGDLFPKSPLDGSFWERTAKYKVRGEKVGMNRFDVLKKIPYPALENTSNVTHNWLWFQLSDDYLCRYVNEVCRVYYIEVSERGDQISRARSTNVKGYFAYNSYVTRHYMHHFWEDPKFFLKAFVKVDYYLMWLKLSLSSELKETKSWLAKLGLILAWPAAMIWFRRWGPKQRG